MHHNIGIVLLAWATMKRSDRRYATKAVLNLLELLTQSVASRACRF